MAVKIWDILRKRFPENEYALMEEVSDAAGFNRSRSADYIAVNLWPSRGLAINGIELKSGRGDWLNELKNPKKAENIFQYCDFFWLLTEDETVAKLEEIPISWGWLCIKGEKIFTKKEAPILTPKDISRNFLCSMLKRASDKSKFIRLDAIDEHITKAREMGKDESRRTITQVQSELKELKNLVDEFQGASGIQITNHRYHINDPKKIGEAVKFLEQGGAEQLKKQLLSLEDAAKRVMVGIELGIKSLNT